MYDSTAECHCPMEQVHMMAFPGGGSGVSVMSSSFKGGRSPSLLSPDSMPTDRYGQIYSRFMVSVQN